LLLSDAILVMTAALLCYAAFNDLRQFTIPNTLIVILGSLFFAHAGLIGRWASIPWHVGFALVIFMVLLLFYARQWIGGGDVKLLTIAFLWTGISNAFAFSVLLCVFATLQTIAAKFGLTAGRIDSDGRTRIPFAPSIAGALIGAFILSNSMR
jgi:prepilin peptidase CpaA